MTVLLITPPAVEPVSLADAKAHLRLETTTEDDYVSALIVAARLHVETAIRRVLVDQTWRVYLDAWPRDGVVDLPVGPVRSIASITVYDADGHPSLLSSVAWRLDSASQPARLALLGTGPTPGRVLNGIEIDLVAGFGPSGISVPQPLKLAIMTLVARWYENREGARYGVVPASVADQVEALVAPFRALRLA
jgi:uncharacterized phiE125 gp8 family phage protein